MKKSVLVMSLALATGCSPNKLVINGIEVYEKHWLAATRDVGRRASVQMNCPVDQLEFLLLHREMRDPTEIEVTGCGRTAVYERPIATAAGHVIIGSWRIVGVRE